MISARAIYLLCSAILLTHGPSIDLWNFSADKSEGRDSKLGINFFSQIEIGDVGAIAQSSFGSAIEFWINFGPVQSLVQR